MNSCISKVYVSGSNSHGQTGHPMNQKQFFSPQPCHFGVPIQQVACGYYHTLLLVKGGWVYHAGDKHDNPTALPLKDIIRVYAGGWHNFAVNDTNQIFVWGKNDDGQLGLGHNNSITTPEILGLPKRSYQISLGAYHTVVWDENEILSTGRGIFGQLCNGEAISQNVLTKVEFQRVRTISSGETHTILLDYQRRVWISGIIGKGFTLRPTEIKIPNKVDPITVCAGRKASAVVGRDGTLCIIEDGSCVLFSEFKVKQIKLKSDTYIAQDLDGKLYSWGKNNFGELALGDINDRDTPTLINLKDVIEFDVGETHSIFHSQEDLPVHDYSVESVCQSQAEQFSEYCESSITLSTGSPNFQQDIQKDQNYFNKQKTLQTLQTTFKTLNESKAESRGKENLEPQKQQQLISEKDHIKTKQSTISEFPQYRSSMEFILKDNKIADLQLLLSEKDELISQLRSRIAFLESQNVRNMEQIKYYKGLV